MHHGTAIPSSSRSPIESSEAVPGPSRIVVEPADGLQSQVEHNQIAGTNEAQNNSYIPQSELESQELEKSRSRESGGVLVADEIEEDRDLQGEGEESRQEENDMDMDADYDMTAWATSNANWESSQERLPRAPTPPNRDPMATEHQTRMPTMEELMDEDPSTSSSSYAASTSGLNNQGNNDNADNLDTDGAQGAMDSNTSDTPDQTNTPPNHFIEELNAQLLRNLRQSILAGHVPPQFMQGFTFPPLIGVGVVGGRVITGIPPGVLAGGIIGAADGHYMTAEEYLQEDPEPVLEQPDPIMDIEADNPDFARFCERLYYYSHFDDTRFKINYAALEIRRLKRQEAVTREDMDEKKLDYQAIPWDTLGLTRDEFRTLRNKSYRNYRNLGGPNPPTEVLPETRRFFRFRRQDNSHKVRFAHFQLRNTLGVTSRNDVYYASGDARVRRAGANMQGSEVIMDLTNTNSLSRSAAPMKITTMATRHGICIAGGFAGEYALKRLDAPLSSLPTIGHVTLSESGITNHVHAHLSRTSATPLAVFSSNDSKIRVLDCYTNTFLCEQPFDWPINCSATSPDSRLRVLVGDNKGVLIVDADRGETLKVLEGHQDYGFSCAWSDDGYTIATGNQDQTVRIYDARNFGKVVAELGTQIAGARSLRFSEVGMGRRVLVVPEPADYVTVVDATTWKDCQRFDFFGEVGGCEFSPVGGELFVANTDVAVGGLMEFERMKGMDDMGISVLMGRLVAAAAVVVEVVAPALTSHS
ncbi:hypothetical protein DFH27DRAFT_335966 [Peziza echinospora]|nr:hypothetical protein DFH27DRAFT_335966 [Peziza echinospora]